MYAAPCSSRRTHDASIAPQPAPMTLLLRLVVLLLLSVAARAQDVLVVWGDSIAAGFGTEASQGTPYGPAPFGDPLPNAYRWDAATQSWGPVTSTQNLTGLGADPTYGFVAGYQRLRGGAEVYVISLAVSGSDATASHPNPLGSWHPTVSGAIFEQFTSDYLSPALSSLSFPQIRAIMFTAGNNVWTPDLGSDVDAINGAIRAYAPWSNPRYLGVKSYLGTPNDPNTMLQRASIDAWSSSSGRRHGVETVSIPARTGGLVDNFHLTHYGAIFLGFWGAVTEFFGL